mgnify:CR=1 FL=1
MRVAAQPAAGQARGIDQAGVVEPILHAQVVVAAARQHWGNSGLYAAAALSGLTDMDAITLSTARLVSTGNLEAATGWRMILLGGMANMAFKMALAMLLGARAFVKPVLTGFSVALVGGVLILALWP